MENTGSSQGRLVDYLILVGPGRGVVFEQVNSTPAGRERSKEIKQRKRISDWQSISTPVSTILCQFPSTDHKDFELSSDVAYFCQPEGCCIELKEPQTHKFMLTDTESNVRTYGVCLTFPHLFDPNMESTTAGSSLTTCTDVMDSICIQEWGVLSVCILSHHPFFTFFRKCLSSLSHFIDDLGIKGLTWNAMIHAQHNVSSSSTIGSSLGVPKPGHTSNTKGRGENKIKVVAEVEDWIGNLLLLPSPGEGGNEEVEVQALEVELQIDPATMVCYPPKSHFPLLDLPLHQIILKMGIRLVLEIFKLVLSEQKVIVHSKEAAFSSECVMGIASLLYPLQYLYPIIPLLPSSMPVAENLLMVPTPFFIGVCDSFMKKVRDYQVAETWVVNLDSKQVKEPQVMDHPVLEFPYSILQLQADIRKALDKLEGPTDTVDGNSLSSRSSTQPISHSVHKNTPPQALGKHTHHSTVRVAEAELSIRRSFVQFLFSVDMLELMEQHLCIYRLFPRPVVNLQSSAFLKAYTTMTPDTGFVQELLKTQCVEYFYQYSLNPTNLAFEEIRKGVTELHHLSDKFPFFVQHTRVKVHQVTLYSPDSTLYLHMLTHKANLAESYHSQDTDGSGSDWEVLGTDFYDGDSEVSASSSYYSDEDSALHKSGKGVAYIPPLAGCGDIHRKKVGDDTIGGILEADLEVEFHTPRSARDLEEGLKTGGSGGISPRVQRRPEHTRRRKGRGSKLRDDLTSSSLSQGVVSSPRLQGLLASGSYDGQVSSIYYSDDGHSFTSTSFPGEVKISDPSSSDADLSPRPRSNALMGGDSGGEVGGVTRSLNRYTHMSMGNLFASQKEAEGGAGGGARLQRRGSVVLRGVGGEKSGAKVGGSPSASVWKSTPLVVGQSPQAAVALEMQIYDLAVRIVEGQGLPWPKPSYLKRISSQEKTRVLMLRLLEEKLGVREPGEMELATGEQIIAVGVTKAVYKGVLELLKYLLLSIEESFLKDSDSSIFSAFLIFRIAFSTYIPPRRVKSNVIGVSLLNALNLNSFVAPSPPGKSKKSSPAKLQSGGLPQISVLDVSKGIKEMHILRKEKERSPSTLRHPSSRSPGSTGDRHGNPKVMGSGEDAEESALEAERRSGTPVLPPGQIVREPANTGSVEEVGSPRAGDASDSKTKAPSSLGSKTQARQDHSSEGGGAKSSSVVISIPNGYPPTVEDSHQHEPPLPDLASSLSSSILSFTSQCQTPPISRMLIIPVESISSPTSDLASSPSPLCSVSNSKLLSKDFSPGNPDDKKTTTTETPPCPPPPFKEVRPSSENSIGRTSPVTPPFKRRRSNSVQSPIRVMNISSQAFLLSDLINSPRFYHPLEGQSLSGCQFLYKDLMRSLVQSIRDLFHSKQFWNQLFVSAVSVERGNLGWNEMTASLYTKYDSLSPSHRESFGFEEDLLISIVLHNLLVYMLMVGLLPQRTMELIQSFAARTRLAIGEERLLQQTLKHIEACVEKNDGKEVDINVLGLLSLYSERHPTISYIVHYGTDMLAPVYKLQITDEVLILRRFPDDRICSRLWNDCITIVHYNKARATVSVCYRDMWGEEYYHHFHTMQYKRVYKSLQALVSPGKVESVTSDDDETDATTVA